MKVKRIKMGLYELAFNGKLYTIKHDKTKYWLSYNAWAEWCIEEDEKPIYRTHSLQDAKEYLAKYLKLE